MATHQPTTQWISIRAKEAEFREFMNSASTEEAIEKATQRCLKNEVDLCTSKLATLKEEYLSFCRVKWGLPANAGAAA